MARQSAFVRDLEQRGLVHQATDLAALDRLAADPARPLTAYVGYDLTAPSLHVGHLVTMLLLRRLQQAGGRPIVLLGGATTMVGDPSGRDSERQLLDEETIAANREQIRRQFASILAFDGPNAALVVDNRAWLGELGLIGFLRDVGARMSVNRMLSMDSVRLRLERDQPLSLLEFSYMTLQAYDFAELWARHGCTLQMGGSDQWGNIVMGIDLGRRMHGAELHGLTAPLLTTATGAKMGKTAGGAVWLDRERLSDFDFWQYWRNVDDRDVGRFLAIFTELPMDEVARLGAGQGSALNEAKIRLANEVTALVRGRCAADAAAAGAGGLFAGAGHGGDAQAGLPEYRVGGPLALLEALVASGLASSRSEARRKLAEGAARVDGVSVADPATLVDAGQRLSMGRKRHVRLIRG